jgi:hypothetical protein
MGIKNFTFIKKINSIPNVKEFPYLHNYDACYGYDGKQPHGGQSLKDETTRFDERGIAYKLETEEQRIYRYERLRKRQEIIKNRLSGPKKTNFFIKNLRSIFHWVKKKGGVNSKRVINKDGNLEWQVEYKPVSTKKLNKWLYDSKNNDVFKHLSKSKSLLIKPDKLDIDIINNK